MRDVAVRSWRPSRRVLRLSLLGFTGVVVAAALYAGSSRLPYVIRFSLGFGYAGLALFAASLAVGPVRLISGRRSATSDALRRDIGILAAIFALLHVVFGLQVHFGGNMLAYFLDPSLPGDPVRLSAFGFANHTGLAATLLFILLLALSNNAALRALRVRRWKLLQRSSYLAALLVLAHGALYQVLERRALALVALFAAMTAVTALLQAAGIRSYRRQARPAGTRAS